MASGCRSSNSGLGFLSEIAKKNHLFSVFFLCFSVPSLPPRLGLKKNRGVVGFLYPLGTVPRGTVVLMHPPAMVEA